MFLDMTKMGKKHQHKLLKLRNFNMKLVKKTTVKYDKKLNINICSSRSLILAIWIESD